MSEKYTEEDKSLLSEEELAAIEEDDEEVSEEAAEDTDEPVEEEVGEEEVDEEDAPEEADEEEPAEEEEEESPAEEERPKPPEVPDGVDLPGDFKTQREALKKQYEDGELDLVDYMDARDDITRAETAYIEGAKAWQRDQKAFFAEVASEIYSNPVLYDALNAQVVKIANSAEAANLSGADILKKADEAVRGAFSIRKETPKEPEKPKMPKAKRPDIKTLAEIPTAAPTDVGGGEFAGLEKLRGEALEEAIAKMSDTQYQRYLRGA